MKNTNRRDFLRAAGISGMIAATTAVKTASAQEPSSPAKTGPTPEPARATGVGRPKDPKNLVAMEIGHVPIISVPASIKKDEVFNVVVTVGQRLHPMQLGHFINWITLFVGDEPVATLDLSPIIPQAVGTFPLRLNESAELRAQARCNLHGVWENSLKVEVS